MKVQTKRLVICWMAAFAASPGIGLASVSKHQDWASLAMLCAIIGAYAVVPTLAVMGMDGAAGLVAVALGVVVTLLHVGLLTVMWRAMSASAVGFSGIVLLTHLLLGIAGALVMLAREPIVTLPTYRN
jgi:hypothetical protein